MSGRGSAEPEVPYVLTLGESMGLVRQTAPGRLATERAVALGFGGAESNVAIGLSRLGIGAVWCGRVGDDSIGEMITRELRAEGVTPVAVIDSGAPTGLMLKERPGAGTSRVTYYRTGSAGSCLEPDDVHDSLIAGAALVHVTGITPALSSSADAAVESVMRRARAAGLPVALDVNFRSALWSRTAAAKRLIELVALADLAFAGADEARLLLGDLPLQGLVDGMRELGPSEVVIKLGARGCTAFENGVRVDRAAIPVDVIDTVGAGDAFVAGYLAERVIGADLEQRVDTAVAAGAFACTMSGDWEGLPRRQDFAMLTEIGDPVRR